MVMPGGNKGDVKVVEGYFEGPRDEVLSRWTSEDRRGN